MRIQNNLRIAVVTLATALVSPVASQAQEGQSLTDRLNRVINTVSEKEPEWQVAYKPRFPQDGWVRWIVPHELAAHESVFVRVKEWESDYEAFRWFRITSRELANAGLPERIRVLGDEASMWGNHPGSTSVAIVIRKGRTLVSINATALATAKRFARYTMDQMD